MISSKDCRVIDSLKCWHSQADKVTVAFPMRFKDSVDTILATSFLKVTQDDQSMLETGFFYFCNILK